MKYWPTDELHYAVRDGYRRWHRACNRHKRYYGPNEDTDTREREEVSCLRCRRTRAWRNVVAA